MKSISPSRRTVANLLARIIQFDPEQWHTNTISYRCRHCEVIYTFKNLTDDLLIPYIMCILYKTISHFQVVKANRPMLQRHLRTAHDYTDEKATRVVKDMYDDQSCQKDDEV